MGYPVDRAEARLIEPFGTTSGRKFPHTGDDWSRLDKTQSKQPRILAAYAGTVVAAGWHAQAGYRTVVDYAELPIIGVYGHQSLIDPRIRVGVGVTEGQPIGAMGATGATSGIHLHYAQYSDLDRALSGIVAYWMNRKGLTLAAWAAESGLTRPDYNRIVKARAPEEDDMAFPPPYEIRETFSPSEDWIRFIDGYSTKIVSQADRDLLAEYLEAGPGAKLRTSALQRVNAYRRAAESGARVAGG